MSVIPATFHHGWSPMTTLDEPPPQAKASRSHTALKRSMKMFGALLITLSAVTPASSVFIIAPTVVKQAGAGAMLSFIIAAVIGLFIAFIYAELSSAFPHAGGEYAIVGRVMGPFWGFVIMGVTLISYILMSAVMSLGVANFLTPLFPGLTPVTGAIVTVIVATALSLLNIKTNALITGAFLVVELIALVVVAGLGFANVNRPLSELFLTPVHLTDAGALEPVSLGAIGLATSVAIFAYSGYSGAIYLSEETHDAPRHIARAILWALAVTIVAEAIPVAAILLGAPDMKEMLSSTNLVGDFIASLGGSGLNTVISLGITLAIVNAVIAFMIMDARLVYATARDQMWLRGLNHALTRIDERFGSPHIATLACGAATLLACFIDETLLMVITGASLLVIYGAMCVAAIVGRRKGSTSCRVYHMPWYPFVPVVALAAMGYVVYANLLDEKTGQPSLLATVAMMAISALYYVLVLRRGEGWEPQEERGSP
jgi:amino acid transporter